MRAGPAINHFQQVEQKGAIFWVPLLFAIGLAEAYRVGLGWEYPKSEKFFQLRDDYEVRAVAQSCCGTLYYAERVAWPGYAVRANLIKPHCHLMWR